MMSIQKFGGDWTEDKLGKVIEYLGQYTTALKNQRFELEYIDAFAGTGWRQKAKKGSTYETMLFPELQEGEIARILEGSARRALKVEPPFHHYTFIEKSPGKVKKLSLLTKEFPDKDIRVLQGDANELVREICRGYHRFRRAVIFLDPYGMQLAWATLEAIAETRSMDTWILFPLCQGITRMLRRDGQVDERTYELLDNMFGERAWREAFYKQVRGRPTGQLSLFELESEEEQQFKVDLKEVEAYMLERLRSIFPVVVPDPVRLRNSKNVILYLLFFVAGNRKGGEIAMRIAKSIMKS